jgi:hypothetical protein
MIRFYSKYSILIRKYPNTIYLPQNVVDPPLEGTKLIHEGLNPDKPEITNYNIQISNKFLMKPYVPYNMLSEKSHKVLKGVP